MSSSPGSKNSFASRTLAWLYRPKLGMALICNTNPSPTPIVWTSINSSLLTNQVLKTHVLPRTPKTKHPLKKINIIKELGCYNVNTMSPKHFRASQTTSLSDSPTPLESSSSNLLHNNKKKIITLKENLEFQDHNFEIQQHTDEASIQSVHHVY